MIGDARVITDALAERSVTVPRAADREDLAAFLARACRLDDAAVVRLRARGDGAFVVWTATGLDVLASRTVAGTVLPGDVTVGADTLRDAVRRAGATPFDPGFAMDSAWRGSLPPDDSFVHVDDVPVPLLADLAERGATLAREQSSTHGPPVSLLDQNVLDVVGDAGRVGVPMRMLFALTAMGFVPPRGAAGAAEDAVRVRLAPTWLRLDARYGSVFRRRGGPLLVAADH